MPGMHGHYTAVTALQKADLLVVARRRDSTTASPATWPRFAPHAKVIHVDIDPAEIGKNRAADVPIVGDAKDVTAAMAARAREGRRRSAASPDRSRLARDARRLAGAVPAALHQEDGGPLKPQYVIDRLYEATRGEATIVSGVGQHQMWASQHYKFTQAAPVDQLRRPGHDGLRRPGRHRRQDRRAPTSWWSPSTATAASR